MVTELNGSRTYEAIANALPQEIQIALVTVAAYQGDERKLERLFLSYPAKVFIALYELCLVTEWNEATKKGMEITRLGRHLVNYCKSN